MKKLTTYDIWFEQQVEKYGYWYKTINYGCC